MVDILKLIRGHSNENARAALYYAARSVKQATLLEQSEKDIFDDDVWSAPSKAVRKLTWDLISAIEADAGKPTARISDDRAVQILNQLTLADKALETKFTSGEKEAARRAIGSMTEPVVRKQFKQATVRRKHSSQ